jgi:hypothetical protein
MVRIDDSSTVTKCWLNSDEPALPDRGEPVLPQQAGPQNSLAVEPLVHQVVEQRRTAGRRPPESLRVDRGVVPPADLAEVFPRCVDVLLGKVDLAV